jgi:hypothetical protein
MYHCIKIGKTSQNSHINTPHTHNGFKGGLHADGHAGEA